MIKLPITKDSSNLFATIVILCAATMLIVILVGVMFLIMLAGDFIQKLEPAPRPPTPIPKITNATNAVEAKQLTLNNQLVMINTQIKQQIRKGEYKLEVEMPEFTSTDIIHILEESGFTATLKDNKLLVRWDNK